MSHQHKVGDPQTNDYVERFNRTVLDEFFRSAFRYKFYESVEELHEGLDKWLAYCNTKATSGIPQSEARSLERIEEYLESFRHDG